MESFFVARGYPVPLVREGRRKAASTPRALLLAGENANQTATTRVPMVTTYYPKNTPVCNILSRNVTITSWQMMTPPKSSFQNPTTGLQTSQKLEGSVSSLRPLDDNLSKIRAPFPADTPSVALVPTSTSPPQFYHRVDKSRSQGIKTCTSDNVIYCISCRKCPVS